MYRDSKLGLCIDLQGPDGNVFCLIGCARQLAKQLEKDPDAIANEMMSDDYDTAIKVFKREFPVVTLLNEQ